MVFLIIVIVLAIIFFVVAKNMNNGGNYSLIAKMITTYYVAIEDNPKGKALGLREKLYFAALLDTAVYIQSGRIALDKLESAVDVSYRPDEVHKSLVNLCITVEILIFREDSNFSMEEIAQAVMSKKDTISYTVSQTLANAKYNEEYSVVKAAVDRFFEDDEYLDLL